MRDDFLTCVIIESKVSVWQGATDRTGFSFANGHAGAADVADASGWGAAAGTAGAETEDPVLADVEGGTGGVTNASFFASDMANTKRPKMI